MVALRSKELWLVEKNRATVKPDSSDGRFSLNENLQRKQNWTAKSTNLEENAGKIKSVFVIGEALWAEKLWRCLENYRSWKKYPRKTCGYGQPRGHLIRVLNERSVNDGGDFCLCGCLMWLDIVSETHFSWDTVDRGLWLAILSSLLCPKTDRNIRIGKQGYLFILLILRSDVLMFHFRHQSACQQLFWHWEKLRQNPPDVGVTSGQKPWTKIIYIVLQTSVGLF